MERRNVLSVIPIGVITGSGCLQVNEQPAQVPVWIENQTEQLQTGEVEWTENRTNESLLSTPFELEPGAEDPFYAEPIRAGDEYTVSVDIGGIREEVSVSGGSLREIDAVIRSTDSVHFEIVPT